MNPRIVIVIEGQIDYRNTFDWLVYSCPKLKKNSYKKYLTAFLKVLLSNQVGYLDGSEILLGPYLVAVT